MAESSRVLEVFSDYTCPFCYFNMENAEKLAKEFNIPIRWRYYPLHSDVPDEGIALTELLDVPLSEVEKWDREFSRTAAQLGLPFCSLDKTYNSRLAQELGLWAADQGKGHAFHKAAFEAFFGQGLNLASKEVLLNIAEKAGLPLDEAEKIITDRTYQEAVDKEWEAAEAKAITAVPTMIFGENRLIGAKSWEQMTALVQAGLADQ